MVALGVPSVCVRVTTSLCALLMTGAATSGKSGARGLAALGPTSAPFRSFHDERCNGLSATRVLLGAGSLLLGGGPKVNGTAGASAEDALSCSCLRPTPLRASSISPFRTAVRRSREILAVQSAYGNAPSLISNQHPSLRLLHIQICRPLCATCIHNSF